MGGRIFRPPVHKTNEPEEAYGSEYSEMPAAHYLSMHGSISRDFWFGKQQNCRDHCRYHMGDRLFGFVLFYALSQLRKVAGQV